VESSIADVVTGDESDDADKLDDATTTISARR
jgi:hypothetical protein